MKNKENKESSIFTKFSEFIKEMKKTPRGKGILFFGGYFFFFVFLIIIFRIVGSGTPLIQDSSKYEIGSSYNYLSSGIVSNNYHFKYTVTLDNNTYIYEGDRIGKKEKFLFTSSLGSFNYFKNDDVFYIENESLELVSNPYILNYFLDFGNIKQIIDKATYVSKTEYDSGRDLYNSEISTTTLLKLVDNIKVDLGDPVNKITLATDDNNNLCGISLDISSYTKYKGMSTILGSVQLEYSKFGEIKEFDK